MREVCCRQKGFDRARRAGLIDVAVAWDWDVVERDGVGVGVCAGVGCMIPLGSSLPGLVCRVKLCQTCLVRAHRFSYDFI